MNFSTMDAWSACAWCEASVTEGGQSLSRLTSKGSVWLCFFCIDRLYEEKERQEKDRQLLGLQAPTPAAAPTTPAPEPKRCWDCYAGQPHSKSNNCG